HRAFNRHARPAIAPEPLNVEGYTRGSRGRIGRAGLPRVDALAVVFIEPTTDSLTSHEAARIRKIRRIVADVAIEVGISRIEADGVFRKPSSDSRVVHGHSLASMGQGNLDSRGHERRTIRPGLT